MRDGHFPCPLRATSAPQRGNENNNHFELPLLEYRPEVVRVSLSSTRSLFLEQAPPMAYIYLKNASAHSTLYAVQLNNDTIIQFQHPEKPKRPLDCSNPSDNKNLSQNKLYVPIK